MTHSLTTCKALQMTWQCCSRVERCLATEIAGTEAESTKRPRDKRWRISRRRCDARQNNFTDPVAPSMAVIVPVLNASNFALHRLCPDCVCQQPHEIRQAERACPNTEGPFQSESISITSRLLSLRLRRSELEGVAYRLLRELSPSVRPPPNVKAVGVSFAGLLLCDS